jgi:hypothetical protein
MADSRGYRDSRTGRFARRPVPDVDAESRFDPMGGDIPFVDVSGAPSASTTERPRYAPTGDTLAGPRPSYGSSPLRGSNPTLVHPADDGITTRSCAALCGALGRLTGT